MDRKEFVKGHTLNNDEFNSYKKVIISEYYELIAKTCYEFIEGIKEVNLNNNQAHELMSALADALKGGRKENLELTNYVASYTMSRILGELLADEKGEE